jgi:hypothetical protein
MGQRWIFLERESFDYLVKRLCEHEVIKPKMDIFLEGLTMDIVKMI